MYLVPPSGGSLEIGNLFDLGLPQLLDSHVPPSGGSLEIGNFLYDQPLIAMGDRSPFGGIPRNWKRVFVLFVFLL